MQAPAKAMPMDNSIVYLGEVSSDGFLPFRLLSCASAAPLPWTRRFAVTQQPPMLPPTCLSAADMCV